MCTQWYLKRAHYILIRGSKSHARVLETQPRYLVLQTCLSRSKSCIADMQKSAKLTEQGDTYSDRHQSAVIMHVYSTHHVLARLAQIPRQQSEIHGNVPYEMPRTAGGTSGCPIPLATFNIQKRSTSVFE